MDKEVMDYLDKHSVLISEINNFKSDDKFMLFNSKLYIKTTQKDFLNNYTNNNYLTIKTRNFDTKIQSDGILKDTERPNPYNENFIYYRLVPENNEIITFLIEQSRLNEKIAKVEIEKISSINAKLTFFVVLTIVNIVASIVLALR